jgi:hypothetical protein
MLERELDESYEIGTFDLPEESGMNSQLLVTDLVADQGWIEVGAEAVAE